ncbi:MAG: hypothetical protein QOG64_2309 [Acidimicrobiaceae bacterium]|nr:hypothetical protein [Acidimicrobiaceae bacterium]
MRRLMLITTTIVILTASSACGSSSKKVSSQAAPTTAAPAASSGSGGGIYGSGSASTTPTTAAGAPAAGAPTAAAGAGNGITIKSFTFKPSPLSVPAGTKVTISNEDTTTHTWTSDTKVWDSGNVNPGSTFSFTFAQKGTFSYHCNIHNSMTGTVTVT